jgi:hypothetical protein
MTDEKTQQLQSMYAQILRCATMADIAAGRFSHARVTRIPADMMHALDALRDAENHARAARDAIERSYLRAATLDTAETVRVQENIPAPTNLCRICDAPVAIGDTFCPTCRGGPRGKPVDTADWSPIQKTALYDLSGEPEPFDKGDHD